MIRQLSTLVAILYCIILITACKQNQESDQRGVTEEVTEKNAPVTYKYPSLGNNDLQLLYAMAEKVDIIFYNLPISVNQDDAASAKNSALYVSPAPVTINEGCKPMGRLSWMSDGAIFKEADFYADSSCHYFIFMQQNQPVAANAMSESGLQFFQSIISQVQQRSQ